MVECHFNIRLAGRRNGTKNDDAWLAQFMMSDLLSRIMESFPQFVLQPRPYPEELTKQEVPGASQGVLEIPDGADLHIWTQELTK